MTWVTPTPTSASPGVPAAKFGIAIGSGTNSPSGIGTLFGACANAPRTGTAVSVPSAAIPDITCLRSKRNGISRNPSLLVIVRGLWFDVGQAPISRSDFSFGEYRRKIFPFVEKGRRQLVRLAFDDRAQRALLVDAKIGRRRGPLRNRHAFKRAVALQPDFESGFRLLRLDTAIGFFPAAFDLLPEHRPPSRGIVRCRALGETQRGIGVQRIAGRGLTRRIALVEERCDLRLIEGPLPRLRGFGRLCGLSLRLWRRLLLVFFQSFRDRIDLGRL